MTALRIPNRYFIPLVIFSLAVLTVSAVSLKREYDQRDGLFFRNGNPLAGDFICFYAAGKLAREDIRSLYDFERQRAILNEITAPREIPGALLYLYPPLLTFLFVLLSFLPFLNAYFVWALFSLCLFALSMVFILRSLRTDFRVAMAIIMLGLTYEPFLLGCLVGGQTAAIGLFIYTAIYWALKRRKDFLAGVVLGLGYYKPPLFLIFVLLSTLRKRSQMMAGFLLSAGLLVALTLFVMGQVKGVEYLTLLWQSGTQGVPAVGTGWGTLAHKGVSIGSFIKVNSLSYPEIGTLMYLLFVAGLLAALSRLSIIAHPDPGSQIRDRRFDLCFTFDLTLNLLLAPHLYDYDLTVLLLPAAVHFYHLLQERKGSNTAWSFFLLFLVYTGRVLPYLKVGNAIILCQPLLLAAWTIQQGMRLHRNGIS